MENVFECLLKINDPAELKLTLAVLARSNGRQWVKISVREISSLTGLNPGAIVRGQKEMAKRGYVFRHCDEYKVLWDRLCPSVREKDAGEQEVAELKSYFLRTGFLDLLPVALDLARKLGYGPAEMIEAICKVADKLKSDPPTRSRLGWFRTVYQEKLREARAEILAFRANRPKTAKL